jgi:murein DD-endopeptidase MepM/ murein hydrolase activator NlpD
MILLDRRQLVLTGAAGLAAASGASRALAADDGPSITFSGSMKQGALVIGRAEGAHRIYIDDQEIQISDQGVFAFGLETDQTKPTPVAAIFTNGERRLAHVTPVARQYDEQSITGLPQRTVAPSKEDQARIEREHALVAEARKTDSTETWFNEPFDWPAKGRMSGVFGSRRILNGVPGRRHYGVDIAAGEGAPIRAPAAGRVLIAQNFFLEGGFTLLDHGHGVFTGYMHQSRLMAKPGDEVRRGDRIGSVGATGRATGPHLHWSMNWFQTRLDPSLSARSAAPDKA